MSGPEWARWAFAALFAVVAVQCVARLIRARASDVSRDPWDDSTYGVMSAGMVVMFSPLPTPLPPFGWALLCAVVAVTAAVRLARTHDALLARGGSVSNCTAHVICAGSMAGMFAVLPADGLSGSTDHAGHLGTSGHLVAAAGWAALVYFLGQSVVWGLRVASMPTDSATRPATRLLMGVGMSYMLLTML